MDTVSALADLSIRRACGFVGLGISAVMLSFSFDLALALRSGATLAAVLCLALAVVAWRTPRRDMRQSELWSLLCAAEPGRLTAMPRPHAQALLAGVLRQRLLWHADRVGVVALGLWAFSAVTTLVRAIVAGG